MFEHIHTNRSQSKYYNSGLKSEKVQFRRVVNAGGKKSIFILNFHRMGGAVKNFFKIYIDLGLKELHFFRFLAQCNLVM